MAVLSNCKSCKKVFTFVSEPYCNDCREAEEKEFQKVKNYLYANSKSSFYQVFQDTGVPAYKILQYLREGRIGS